MSSKAPRPTDLGADGKEGMPDGSTRFCNPLPEPASIGKKVRRRRHPASQGSIILSILLMSHSLASGSAGYRTRLTTP